MLDTMRRAASSWLAKALFSLLVLAFAVWGIPHNFLSFGHTWLAKIGSVTIGPEQFQDEYRREINAISQQMGRRLTPDQARQFGLDRRVLSQLIGRTALDEEASRMGLYLSDETLAEGVRKDPNFQGINGQFSKTDFDNILHQMGLSERAFLQMRRQDQQRSMLLGAVSAASAVPSVAVDVMHAYKSETRNVDSFTIDADKVIKVADPDDAKLKEAYEASKQKYMTPELRKLAVLDLPLSAVEKRITITDAEIKAAYDADADRYNVPERRHIEQIAFKDKAAAEAAKKAIAGGKSFLDVAKEAGAKPTDIDLGVLMKKQIIDPKIADVAFSLPKDTVSDVVEGRFATVLLRVVGIQAGVVKTLDDVKAEVRKHLAEDKAKTEIQKLHDKVDDARPGHKSLAETAKALDLPFLEVAAVSRDNKTADGKRAIDSPEGDAIAKAGFERQMGVDQDAVELPDGGYAWIEVLGTTPPKQKSFEEVKAEVKTAWIDGERARLLRELAQKLVERLNKGEPMDKLAQEAGGKVEQALKITRETLPQGLPKNAVTQAFALPKGRAGTTDSADGKSRVVFRVTDIFPAPPATKEQTANIRSELAKQAEGDSIAVLVAGLQDKFGVQVDEAMLKRVLGDN